MNQESLTLIGPFRQLLTMNGMPLHGSITDESLEIVSEAGILVEGSLIKAVGPWQDLQDAHPHSPTWELAGDYVGLPGWIDVHTHICFAGSRANDYAARTAGNTYLEIAKAGGGIWNSVQHTRQAAAETLAALTLSRANRHLQEGVTTIEVKSGYGLSLEAELKMLRAIQQANQQTAADLIPTCLAAHTLPRDFSGGKAAYLQRLVEELFPQLKAEQLSSRIDIFTEEEAFTVEESRTYLRAAQAAGFELTVHADQFHAGGGQLAIEMGAASADHLEASKMADIEAFAQSSTVAVVLPGASLGLGLPFAPARQLLDAGACLAIASDWNPGSAPMGNLLLQASLMGAQQKLRTSEVFAGLTVRAAKALNLKDRGILAPGLLADFLAFPSGDFQEILYQQGNLRPEFVWKKGQLAGGPGVTKERMHGVRDNRRVERLNLQHLSTSNGE
ncbi:MAG: imidazolonepropionase [Bacteroidota bacterium]